MKNVMRCVVVVIGTLAAGCMSPSTEAEEEAAAAEEALVLLPLPELPPPGITVRTCSDLKASDWHLQKKAPGDAAFSNVVDANLTDDDYVGTFPGGTEFKFGFGTTALTEGFVTHYRGTTLVICKNLNGLPAGGWVTFTNTQAGDSFDGQSGGHCQ